MLMDAALKPIQNKVDEGIALSLDDGLTLFATQDIHTLGRLARQLKERKSGKNVFYVLNYYINSTNVCYAGCKFCSFAVDEFKEAERLVRMSADQVMDKALETGTNFNQLHIVGGHDPRQLSLDYWLPLMRRFKERLPHVQLSLFTSAEIDYMARRHRLGYPEILSQLKDAGLDNINGGGAEVFAERFRKIVCPNKVTADQWLAIHEEAHRQGIASNATMLYGTIETPRERVEHMAMLRALQDETGGFNCFIPLAYQPKLARSGSKSETTGVDDLKTIAISRLMLDNFPHIKAYWIDLGPKLAQVALQMGADDLDGTIVEERISHAQRSFAPLGLKLSELVRLIKEAGRIPTERDTLYNIVREY